MYVTHYHLEVNQTGRVGGGGGGEEGEGRRGRGGGEAGEGRRGGEEEGRRGRGGRFTRRIYPFPKGSL